MKRTPKTMPELLARTTEAELILRRMVVRRDRMRRHLLADWRRLIGARTDIEHVPEAR